MFFAAQIQDQHQMESVVDPATKSLPGEKVFENGFNPLEGSFSPNENPLNVFSQWTEILPTDQLVAVEYRIPDQP
jgi:hypothetical protein